MVLSEADRAELHSAVVDYLKAQKLPEDAVAAIDGLLRPAPGRKFADTDSSLEKRWSTLRRLATRLAEVESQNKQLEAQVRQAQDPGAAKVAGKDALPNEPAIAVLRGHRDAITAVCLHPHEPIAYSSSEDGSIRMWDTRSRNHLQTLREHSDNVACMALEPLEAAILASGGNDQTVKLCDALRGECLKTLHGHEEGVTCLAWVGDANKTLLSCDRGGTVRVWDTRNGGLVGSMKHDGWVRSIAVSTLGGPSFVCGGNDCVLSTWHWHSATRTAQWTAHTNAIQTVCYSHYEADCVLIESHGNVDQKESLKAFQRRVNAARSAGDVNGSNSILASYEPRFVASGARDKLILITDVVTREPILTLSDHENWVRQVAFSANGKYLLSCSDDGFVIVSELAIKRVYRKIAAHEHFVTAFAMHPTLKPMCVTGSADGTVKLWPCS